MTSILTGTDLVEIQRFRTSLDEHGERFAARLFTDRERAYCRTQHRPEASLAARFAAKEAVRKIFGQWGYADMVWRETEVVTEKSGAPRVVLHGEAGRRAAGWEFSLSLSHTQQYALAFCVAYKRKRDGRYHPVV
jgi:holo-[acyl-carrier protein] synthase